MRGIQINEIKIVWPTASALTVGIDSELFDCNTEELNHINLCHGTGVCNLAFQSKESHLLHGITRSFATYASSVSTYE